MRVVGLFQLVFDNDLVISAGAQDVELELAHPILCSYKLKVGQTQRIGQRVEVVLFGQPGREVVSFVLPGFAQGDSLKFAERFFHAKDSSSWPTTGNWSWPEIRRGSKVSRSKRNERTWSLFTCRRSASAVAMSSKTLTNPAGGRTN